MPPEICAGYLAGDLRRVLVRVLAEPDQLELHLDLDLDDVVVEQGVLLEGKRDVLGHGHRVEERPGLEQDPDLLLDLVEPLLVQFGQVLPHEHDTALVGRQGTDHVPQDRALARARAAHDDHRLARLDVEVDPGQHRLVAETLDEVPDLNDRLICHLVVPGPAWSQAPSYRQSPGPT
jgi:hypothetical protein